MLCYEIYIIQMLIPISLLCMHGLNVLDRNHFSLALTIVLVGD